MRDDGNDVDISDAFQRKRRMRVQRATGTEALAPLLDQATHTDGTRSLGERARLQNTLQVGHLLR